MVTDVFALSGDEAVFMQSSVEDSMNSQNEAKISSLLLEKITVSFSKPSVIS